MTKTSAPDQYCAYCGGVLSAFRTYTPLRHTDGGWGPEYAAVHLGCSDDFSRLQTDKFTLSEERTRAKLQPLQEGSR